MAQIAIINQGVIEVISKYNVNYTLINPSFDKSYIYKILNGGLKMKKTLGKIHTALNILVLFLSMIGVLFIFMNKPIENNDPIHMNFMSRFIFTYDFRIPIIMFLISLIVFIIRRSKRSGITFTLSIVSLSYTVMFIYMIAETIGQIS